MLKDITYLERKQFVFSIAQHLTSELLTPTKRVFFWLYNAYVRVFTVPQENIMRDSHVQTENRGTRKMKLLKEQQKLNENDGTISLKHTHTAILSSCILLNVLLCFKHVFPCSHSAPLWSVGNVSFPGLYKGRLSGTN
jgi:hypothetical protein